MFNYHIDLALSSAMSFSTYIIVHLLRTIEDYSMSAICQPWPGIDVGCRLIDKSYIRMCSLSLEADLAHTFHSSLECYDVLDSTIIKCTSSQVFIPNLLYVWLNIAVLHICS